MEKSPFYKEKSLLGLTPAWLEKMRFLATISPLHQFQGRQYWLKCLSSCSWYITECFLNTHTLFVYFTIRWRHRWGTKQFLRSFKFRTSQLRFLLSSVICVSLQGVNFTNILRAAFLYKIFAQSFFVFKVNIKLFIRARKLVQLCSLNVGEIDSRTAFLRTALKKSTKKNLEFFTMNKKWNFNDLIKHLLLNASFEVDPLFWQKKIFAVEIKCLRQKSLLNDDVWSTCKHTNGKQS